MTERAHIRHPRQPSSTLCGKTISAHPQAATDGLCATCAQLADKDARAVQPRRNRIEQIEQEAKQHQQDASRRILEAAEEIRRLTLEGTDPSLAAIATATIRLQQAIHEVLAAQACEREALYMIAG